MGSAAVVKMRSKGAQAGTPAPPGQGQLEKELAEFSGGLAYDQARIIERTQEGFRQGVHGFYLAGLGLILIKAHDGYTFTHILEQFFPGITYEAAKKYMRFARAASALPNFKAFCLERGGYSKGLTMLQAATEEQIQEFDDTGIILGYSQEQIDGMSVVSLKKALRRAREYTEQKVKGATYKSEKQIADQADRIRDLEAQVPKETPADAAFALIKRAEDKMLECFRLLNQVPDQALVDSELVRDALYAFTGMADRAIANLEIKANLAIPQAEQQKWEKERKGEHTD